MPESNPLPPPSPEQVEALREWMRMEGEFSRWCIESDPERALPAAAVRDHAALGRSVMRLRETGAWEYLALLAASLTVTMGWKSVPIPLDAPPDEWRFTTDWEPAEGGAGHEC